MSLSRITCILLFTFLITNVLLFPAVAAEPEAPFSDTDALSVGAATDEATTQTVDTESSNISNTSSRHIGPELTRNEPSAEIVISEAEARIGSRLLNSTDAIQAGQFDTAETTISGNTTDLIQQYERLAAQTESTADDEIAQQFNLTVQQQRQLIDTARNSSSTYNEYQLARANGNQTRARQLARTLLEQTQDGNQTAEELLNQYEQLANETDLNATQTIAGINDAQARLADIQNTVRSETLTPTSLRVSSSAVASPIKPIQISGQLTSNNSQLANQSIEISLSDTTVQTETNGDGEFSTMLRPLSIASGQQTLSVQFSPEPTSIYDGQRVEKSVRIDSVVPTADTQYSPSQVQFNDTVEINGEVTAGEISLSDVPVSTTIAGQPFKSARTDDQGVFRIQEPLPATVPNGTQQIEVVISKQNRSVQQVIQTTELDVASTETELAFTSIQTNGSNIEFVGQLTTTEGTELSDRNIVISQGDSSSVVSYTNQSGYFEGSVPIQSSSSISQLLFSPDKRTLTAEYDAGGENLISSTQNTVVSYNPPISVPLQQIAIVGLSLAIILIAIVLWRRREIQSNEAEDTLQKIADSETTLPPHSAVNISPDRLLSHAEKQYTEGNIGAAARLSYAALRQQYMEAYDVTGSLTHWELYQTLRPELNSPTQELLYEATAVYEQELYSDVDFSAHDELGIVLEQLGEVIGSDESAT